jgi:hypothetical protein
VALIRLRCSGMVRDGGLWAGCLMVRPKGCFSKKEKA